MKGCNKLPSCDFSSEQTRPSRCSTSSVHNRDIINHYYNIDYADELDFINCDLTSNMCIKFINDNRSKMFTSIDHVARNKSSIKLF